MILLPSIMKFYEMKDDIVKKYDYLPQTETIEEESKEKKNRIEPLSEFPQLKEEKVKSKKVALEKDPIVSQETVEKTPEELEKEQKIALEKSAFLAEKTKVEKEIEEKLANAKAVEAEAAAKAEELIAKAKAEAETILQKAQEEAVQSKQAAEEQGYQEGLERGTAEGTAKAETEGKERYDAMCQEAMQEIKMVVESAESMKEEMFQKYRSQLKDVAVAIAEKVIQVSLKSSGEVIERMIIAATEKLKTREWARVYIARCDADMMIEGDSALLRQLAHLSDHVKIVVMENETPGTCIIELPDEIIDASASTQMVNIKEILNSAAL